MKRPQRILVIVLLVWAAICLALALTGTASKWITTAGLFFGLAGLLQLDISGLFDRIFKEYGYGEKYPFGPPSAITRDIIEIPDTSLRSRLRDTFFFDPRTGFQMIVVGFVLQLLGVWT